MQPLPSWPLLARHLAFDMAALMFQNPAEGSATGNCRGRLAAIGPDANMKSITRIYAEACHAGQNRSLCGAIAGTEFHVITGTEFKPFRHQDRKRPLHVNAGTVLILRSLCKKNSGVQQHELHHPPACLGCLWNSAFT